MYSIGGRKRAVGFELAEGMEIPEESGPRFNFARQKSKLAGVIRGSYGIHFVTATPASLMGGGAVSISRSKGVRSPLCACSHSSSRGSCSTLIAAPFLKPFASTKSWTAEPVTQTSGWTSISRAGSRGLPGSTSASACSTSLAAANRTGATGGASVTPLWILGSSCRCRIRLLPFQLSWRCCSRTSRAVVHVRLPYRSLSM